MLKAVIFDLDGTLTDCDLELVKRRISEELAKLTGESYHDIRKKMERIHYKFNIEAIYDRNVWWDQFNLNLSMEEKLQLTNLYWKYYLKLFDIFDV